MSHLPKHTVEELEARKAALEAQAEMLAREGQPMTEADTQEYEAIRAELQRRQPPAPRGPVPRRRKLS